MIEQIWIILCNKPKPFYSFDFASFEAFIPVQYPPVYTITWVIKHRLPVVPK